MKISAKYRVGGLVALLGISTAMAGTESCTAEKGWEAGRSGNALSTLCTQEPYQEAYRLGSALAELHARHAELGAQMEKTPEKTGELRRLQRQVDVDIEAINGVAVLRGWPMSPLQEDKNEK